MCCQPAAAMAPPCPTGVAHCTLAKHNTIRKQNRNKRTCSAIPLSSGRPAHNPSRAGGGRGRAQRSNTPGSRVQPPGSGIRQARHTRWMQQPHQQPWQGRRGAAMHAAISASLLHACQPQSSHGLTIGDWMSLWAEVCVGAEGHTGWLVQRRQLASQPGRRCTATFCTPTAAQPWGG